MLLVGARRKWEERGFEGGEPSLSGRSLGVLFGKWDKNEDRSGPERNGGQRIIFGYIIDITGNYSGIEIIC